METSKKNKDFDCVEMKNAIQAKIYAETKNMTTDELLAYFNGKSQTTKPPATTKRSVPVKRVATRRKKELT